MAITGIVSDTADLPVARRSFVQKVGRGVEGTLDAPGNFGRSILAGRPLNALRSVIPFAGSDRVPISETILDTGNKAANFGLEILLDPLLFVGGIGAVSKGGKLLTRIKDLRALGKVMGARGNFEGSKKAFDAAEVLVNTFKQLPKNKVLGRTVRGGTKRSLITLEGIPFVKSTRKDIGQIETFNAALSKFPFRALANPKRVALESVITRGEVQRNRLGIRIEEATRVGSESVVAKATEDLRKLDIKMITAQEKLQGLGTPMITGVVAKGITSFVKGLKARFGGQTTPITRALEDITRTEEARLRHLLGADKTEFFANIESMARKSGEEQTVLISRMLKLAESREFTAGSAKFLGGEGKLPLQVNRKRILPVEEVSQAFDNSYRATQLRFKDKLDRAKRIADPVKRQDAIAKVTQRLHDDIFVLRRTKSEEALRWKEIGTILDKATPSEIAFVDLIFKNTDDMIGIERAHRIKISTLQSDKISYVRRIISPVARTLKKSDPKKYNRIFTEARVSLGAAYKRKIMPELGILEVNDMLKKTFGLKFDFFDPDVIKAATFRRAEHNIAVNKAASVNAFVSLMAKSRETGHVGVSARRVYEKAGLEWKAIDDLPEIASELVIPDKLVDEFFQYDKIIKEVFENEPTLIKWLDVIDKNVNSVFRAGLTTLFPAFHHRNAFSNMFLNHLGGVNPLDGWYNSARHFQRMVVKSPTDELRKLESELMQYRITRTGQIEEFRERAGITEKIGPFLENPTGIGRFTVGTGRKYGQFIEENARIAHYMAKRGITVDAAGKVIRGKSSLTEIEAMRSVNKYLFDYSKLTPFEKKVARPMFLFYTWMRKNIPLMVGTVMTNPRLGANYFKIINQGEGEVPDYLKSSSVIPNPFGKGFISDPGLPLADLNVFNIDDVDPSNLEGIYRLGSRIASRLAPAGKMAYSLITNRDPFTGAKQSDKTTTRFVEELLPTSRATRTVSKLFDGDVGGVARFLNFTTGLRTFKFSKTKGRRSTVTKAAIGTGKFRRLGDSQIIFPKREFKEDPIVKRIQVELRRLNKEIKEQQ